MAIMLIQHAPSIPPLVPDERAIRVFTILWQRIKAILLGHVHLLTTFCLFKAVLAAQLFEKMSVLLAQGIKVTVVAPAPAPL
jgi:hypothetical protein